MFGCLEKKLIRELDTKCGSLVLKTIHQPSQPNQAADICCHKTHIRVRHAYATIVTQVFKMWRFQLAGMIQPFLAYLVSASFPVQLRLSLTHVCVSQRNKKTMRMEWLEMVAHLMCFGQEHILVIWEWWAFQRVTGIRQGIRHRRRWITNSQVKAGRVQNQEVAAEV